MTAITSTLAAASFTSTSLAVAQLPDPTDALLWGAAVVTATGVLYRALRIGRARTTVRALTKLAEREQALGTFLTDWNGTAGRVGFDPQPGFPERVSNIERHMREVKGAIPPLAQALTGLAESTHGNGDKIDALDQRVTDHRRRNDEQAEVLRTDLERRARDLEQRLDTRNAEVDVKLSHLADDLFRAQTGRAILHELGIKIEPADEDDPLAPT